jgi:uncharacterized membrane protein
MTSRLAGLSDGVFAICVTLIVIGLKMPDAPDGRLITILLATLPKLEVWALSYLVIGSLWVLQHNIFARLKYADTALLWLNLLFLMCISLLPWTTDLAGVYVREPLAIVLFSGSLGLAGFLLLIAWIYAVGYGDLCSPEVDADTSKAVITLTARIPLVAVISIVLAYVHRSAALWVWLLVTLLGVLIRTKPKRV